MSCKTVSRQSEPVHWHVLLFRWNQNPGEGHLVAGIG